MVRETQRRLALLAIVAIVAVAWATAFKGTDVTPVAFAAAVTPKPAVPVARVAACPFPTALRGAFEVAAADASIPPAMLWAVAKVESAGARYLRQMLDRFHSSDLALAAYNAGPTAVTVAGGAPSIDVQRYISNVNAFWHSVAGCR